MKKYTSFAYGLYTLIVQGIGFFASFLFGLFVAIFGGFLVVLENISTNAFLFLVSLAIAFYGSSYLLRRYLNQKTRHSFQEKYRAVFAIALAVFAGGYVHPTLADIWNRSMERLPDIIGNASEILQLMGLFFVSSVVLLIVGLSLQQKGYSNAILALVIIAGYALFAGLFFFIFYTFGEQFTWFVTFVLGFVPLHWAYALWISPIMQQRS